MTVSEAVADYVDEAVTSTELISLPNMHCISRGEPIGRQNCDVGLVPGA